MWQRLIYHPEINYGLRQTLILCLPIAIALLFDQLRVGLLFSLVPACCNIAGLDTPHRHFIKRLFIGGTLFAVSSVLVHQGMQWSAPLPLVMLAMALLLGVTAEIGPLHARLLPAALVAAIFTLSLPDATPVWYAPMFYIAGTIWYGLFTFFWFRLWQEQPMRESLSKLYLQLADYFEYKYSILTQHGSPEELIPLLLQRQQQVMDTISLVYSQLHMISNLSHPRHKRLLRAFQVALDLQEHITVSLHQPDEVQRLVAQSQADAIIKRNAQVIARRMRIVADDLLYHRRSGSFTMKKELAALEKLAQRYPDNPVCDFCLYHFQRIARLLRNQYPLYNRTLMPDTPHLPFWRALASYLSLRSQGLRSAARLGITLAIGSGLGMVFHLPKPYWILLTIMLVSQNGYNATRVRIQHRALGTMCGLLLASGILMLPFSQNTMLLLMLAITLSSYFVVRKNYGLAVTGFTITAVYTLQLITLDGSTFMLARMVDTVIGCLLALASMIWLWPQWQSGMLRKNAHQALESDQNHLQLMLSDNRDAETLDSRVTYSCMRLNLAHNALFTSLNQAMQEPGFNSQYLADMRLWVTHSQFLAEHLNGMTLLVHDSYKLPEELASHYLQECEISIQLCQQRLEQDTGGPVSHIMQQTETEHEIPSTIMERHLTRILFHLRAMNTISSIIWSQRPHHGIWLKHKLREGEDRLSRS